MHLAFFTFTIGVTNFWIGYFLAVYLRYGSAALRLSKPSPIGIVRPESALSIPASRRIEPPVKTKIPAERPQPVPEPPPEEKTELSLHEMLRGTIEHGLAALKDAQSRLQAARRSQPSKSPWVLVAELQESCKPYLEKLSTVTEKMDGGGIDDAVQGLILDQMAQLETTLNNLQYMNFESGYADAMNRLTSEIKNLLSNAQNLKQAFDETAENADAEKIAAAV